MTRIDVDSSKWPVVRVFLPLAATDDEVREYLDTLARLRSRMEPYALIVVAGKSLGFSSKQRQMQADYIASGLHLSRTYLKAFAFVAGSAMQRGMLTAIFWLRPPEWPHKVFSTLHDAEAWVRSLLGEALPKPRRDESVPHRAQ